MRSLRSGILFLLLFLLFACDGQEVVGWLAADKNADSTAPTVSSTTPANSAANVAINTSITAVFSEEMDPATISEITFTVKNGTTSVAGEVTYVGVTAMFNPADNLAGGTTYTAKIDDAAKDPAGNRLAKDYTWSFTTGTAEDTTTPHVSSTNPADSAADVAINTSVTAVFSEAMDPATISGTTFTLQGGTTVVSGAVSCVGSSATFNPTDNLDSNTLYTATITSGVTDLAGNAMAEAYVWSFTTGETEDTTPPLVSFVTPEDDATEVALNAAITATFSEAMDPLTISTATFTLQDGSTPVSGAVIFVGTTAIFTPTIILDPNTLYSATIASGVTDLAENALADDYEWSFTTGDAVDTTPPQVTSTNPVGGATNVWVNASVIATFTEAMDPQTISTATFTLYDGTTPVAGTVTYVGVTATFNPTGSLNNTTTYTAMIGDSAKDLAGNALPVDYVWNFTTGTAADTTPPQVSFTIPGNDAIDVALNTSLAAIFTEAMDPLTITAATFTLFDGATSIPGAVIYVGFTAVFTPTDSLAPNTEYTATITTGAKDLAGNPLADDYVWTFVTGPVPDTRKPSVTFTDPADDATGVAVDRNIVAVFSEPMDPLTITTENFTVQQFSTIIEGIVTYSGVTATFNPINDLDANTTYSATITTEAKDLAGNSLVVNYVWNFKTSASPDTTFPTVISTIPEDEETGVALNTLVSAVFSEVMNPLTLTTATFTLYDNTTPINGIVIPIGNTAIFNPTDNLEPDTQYTATITNEATDQAGNAMEEDYEWTFTTGTLPDELAPTVIRTNPEDDEADVPLDATVNATFSEDMDWLTIDTETFLVTGPGANEVIGTVVYDVLTRIATFTPVIEFLPATTYTATIATGVTDLAGNAMAVDYVWSFSTGTTPLNLRPVGLGSLGSFVAVAGAGLTNSNSSGATILNGDVGLYPTPTCESDGSPCTPGNLYINGTLYANDPEGVAGQTKTDLTAAYVDGMSRPVGTTVNDITGMTLPPGVYTSNTTMSIAVGGTVTLDGQGDANAVWIFQIGSSLTVNNDAQILTINGAKAKNVFWTIFASSTLGSNVQFQGSVLAGGSNTVGTDSVVVGRLLCATGAISLLSDTITLPIP